MKKKTIIHQFDPVIYPVKLWVSITNDNNALNEQFQWAYDEPKIDIDFESFDAITGAARQKESKLFGILIVFENKKLCSLKNIAHESSHAVDEIWRRLGEERAGNEANAYLIGWIAECIEKVKLNKI